MPSDTQKQIEETLAWIENDIRGATPLRLMGELDEEYRDRLLLIKSILSGEHPSCHRPVLQITISGIAGSGKTTLLQLIRNMLRSYGINVSIADEGDPEQLNWDHLHLSARAAALQKNIRVHIRTAAVKVPHGDDLRP